MPHRGAISAGRRVTRDQEHIERFALSHDGRWLAYDSDRSGNADIYKVSAAGGDVVQLTNDPGDDFSPTWSFDDRQLAFHSSRSGANRRHVYLVNADGSSEMQLTDGPTQERYPDWAPAEPRLLYLVDADSGRALVVQRRNSGGTWSIERSLPSARWAGTPPRWLDAHTLIAIDSRGLTRTSIDSVPPTRSLLADSTVIGVASQVLPSRDGSTVLVNTRQGDSIRIVSFARTGRMLGTLLSVGRSQLTTNYFAVTDREVFLNVADYRSDVWILTFRR